MDPQFPTSDGTNSDSPPAVPAEAAAGQDALVPSQPAEDTAAPEPNAAVRQLESMLQNLSSYAKPVLRQIAVRAAEVAAKAADAAGPVAQRAADLTEDVSGRLAAKSREIAADLRGDASSEAAAASAGSAGSEPSEGSDTSPDETPGS